MTSHRLIVLIACLCSQSFMAHAIILTGDSTTRPKDFGPGGFVKIYPGFDISNPQDTVGADNFQSPNLWGFDESQNVAVGPGGLFAEIGGFLAEGSIVASHYVFFDPVTKDDGGGYNQQGWVLFDAPILAIFTSRDSLANSDYLAHTGVTYLNPNQRGLEGVDSVTIDTSDSKKLTINWNANTPGDYIRVLTERSPGYPVPENGSTFLYISLGLVCLIATARLRSRSSRSSQRLA